MGTLEARSCTSTIKALSRIHVTRFHPDPLQSKDAGRCTAMFLGLVAQQMLPVTECLSTLWVATLM